MTYEGLLDFLAELRPGHALAAWELERVDQIGLDDDYEMRFRVTISLGALVYRYRATSYLPPALLIRDIERRLK